MNADNYRSLEIQQELLLMIQAYGLPRIIDALYQLTCGNQLGSFEDSKQRTIATYFAFALSEATDRESLKAELLSTLDMFS